MKWLLTFSGTQPTTDATLTFDLNTIPSLVGLKGYWKHLKFYDVAGAPLVYWLEHADDKLTGTVFVKVPYITNDGCQIIARFVGEETFGDIHNVGFVGDDFDDSSYSTNMWVSTTYNSAGAWKFDGGKAILYWTDPTATGSGGRISTPLSNEAKIVAVAVGRIIVSLYTVEPAIKSILLVNIGRDDYTSHGWFTDAIINPTMGALTLRRALPESGDFRGTVQFTLLDKTILNAEIMSPTYYYENERWYRGITKINIDEGNTIVEGVAIIDDVVTRDRIVFHSYTRTDVAWLPTHVGIGNYLARSDTYIVDEVQLEYFLAYRWLQPEPRLVSVTKLRTAVFDVSSIIKILFGGSVTVGVDKSNDLTMSNHNAYKAILTSDVETATAEATSYKAVSISQLGQNITETLLEITKISDAMMTALSKTTSVTKATVLELHNIIATAAEMLSKLSDLVATGNFNREELGIYTLVPLTTVLFQNVATLTSLLITDRYLTQDTATETVTTQNVSRTPVATFLKQLQALVNATAQLLEKVDVAKTSAIGFKTNFETVVTSIIGKLLSVLESYKTTVATLEKQTSAMLDKTAQLQSSTSISEQAAVSYGYISDAEMITINADFKKDAEAMNITTGNIIPSTFRTTTSIGCADINELVTKMSSAYQRLYDFQQQLVVATQKPENFASNRSVAELLYNYLNELLIVTETTLAILRTLVSPE